MPEPAPFPPTPTKPVPATQGHTREQAVAYYEKVKKQLRDLIHQKRHCEKQLALYEDNIFKAETAYLEETQNGNIIKGFDNYIKGGVTRRKTAFNDSDRIFSLSSLTYAAKLQQEQESTPVTACSTPTIPEMPRLQTQLVKNKKNPARKRRIDDESESVSEVETPGPKRVRISFTGQGGGGTQ